MTTYIILYLLKLPFLKKQKFFISSSLIDRLKKLWKAYPDSEIGAIGYGKVLQQKRCWYSLTCRFFTQRIDGRNTILALVVPQQDSYASSFELDQTLIGEKINDLVCQTVLHPHPVGSAPTPTGRQSKSLSCFFIKRVRNDFVSS